MYEWQSWSKLGKVQLVPNLEPVWMSECWTIRKAEHWRIDAFELWYWRRLLKVLWTARRSNQSILKEISPGYSLEGLCWSWNSNTLATWCKKLTRLKRPWCWERLKVGGEGDDRAWDSQMASLTRWTWVWASYGSWWWTGKPGVLESMGLQRVRHDWATKLNWRGQTQLSRGRWDSTWRIGVYGEDSEGKEGGRAALLIEAVVCVCGGGFPAGSDGKESACSAEDPVWSLGGENPLEEEMAIHSRILAWKIPWTEEPGGFLCACVCWQKQGHQTCLCHL